MEKMKKWKEKIDYRHLIGVTLILVGIMVLRRFLFL